MAAYLDTSAAAKLVLSEQHSDDLFDEIVLDRERILVASWLLHTELHCAVARRRGGMAIARVDDVLARVRLVDITRQDMIVAGEIGTLRAADAIHLAVAIRLGVDEMITYDAELADAARGAGLRVLSPGL